MSETSVYSAAAPAVAVEWNETRNLQMMQNNLIIRYIYSHVSSYWRHPGYWKAFDEQRFCVIFCLILEHIFHFQFRNRAYCAKWTHFSFSFFIAVFNILTHFILLKNEAIRMRYACYSIPIRRADYEQWNGRIACVWPAPMPLIALANQIRCCSLNFANYLDIFARQAIA